MVRNILSLILLVIWISAVVACREDDSLIQSNRSLVLVCQKPGQDDWNQSRADMATDGRGSFSEGDVIGVILSDGHIQKYAELTYTGGKWIPELNLNEFEGRTVTLSAHYPVIDTAMEDGNTVLLNWPLEQNTPENFRRADCLFATTTVEGDRSSAVLAFAHVMHRLNITLKGAVPEDVDIQVRTAASGYFSLIDGTTTVDEGNYAWIKPQKNADGSYSVLIMPQSVKPYQESEGLLCLKSALKNFVYALPEQEGLIDFQVGKTYNINLAINESGTENEFANTVHWVYGVNAPAFPGIDQIQHVYNHFGIENAPAGEWLRIVLFGNEYQYLTWKEGCGWYDCNKTADYVDDGNLCWAATAANLLHWWMHHNQKYIEAYDAEFGPEYEDYERPSAVFVPMTYENQNHSAIFNFFKRYYADKTGWTASGVNWFLNGEPSYPIGNTAVGFNGFFRHLFTPNNEITTGYKGINKVKFNSLFKEAFTENKAIGFVTSDFGGIGAGLHAMTIWGAEFDENGDVAYIYFCDNNTPDNDPNYAAIQRYKIVYKWTTDLGLYGEYAYMQSPENENGELYGASYLISTIFLTDLELDTWKTKYPNVETYNIE